MRKIYSLVLALMVSIASFADITTVTYNSTSYTVAATQTVEVNATEKTAYEGLVVDYSEQLSSLLTAVGLTSATTDNLVAVEPDGTAYAGTVNDGWHSSDGLVNGYGWGTTKGVCVKPWANDGSINGTISYIGCIDTGWTAGETHTCYYAFINNGKAGLLQVTLTFVAPELPNIENYNLSSTTYDMQVEYTLGDSYEGISASATLDGIYDALGTSASDFDGDITNKVFARIPTENSGGTYSWEGDMNLPASASDGAWFGLYTDANGNQFNAPMGWGSGATIYTQGFTISNGTFTITSTGQMPGTYTTEGEQTPIILYILNSSYAVQINVIPVIKAKETETIDPSTLTKAGETTASVSADINSTYAATSFTIDMSTAATALGCATTDITDIYAYNSDGNITNALTAYSGFYFNENGRIESWGDNAAYYVEATDLPNGAFHVGQMAGHYNNITEATTTTGQIIFVYDSKYYVVNVAYTVNIPATITRTTAIGKYGTICAPFAPTVTGATLYSASLNSDNTTIELTAVDSPIEGIPYIYEATADQQTFAYAHGTVLSVPTEAAPLVGVFTDTPAPVGSYVLQNHDGTIGFYLVAGTIPTVKANHCYLTTTSGAKVLNFSTEATAINAINALTSGNAKIFDINGRQINKLQKGINVVNGVKVLVK